MAAWVAGPGRGSWDRQIQQNQYNHLNWKKTRKRDHRLHSTQHSFETGNSRYAVERTCDGIGVTIIDTCLSLLIDSSVQTNFAGCKILAEARGKCGGGGGGGVSDYCDSIICEVRWCCYGYGAWSRQLVTILNFLSHKIWCHKQLLWEEDSTV